MPTTLVDLLKPKAEPLKSKPTFSERLAGLFSKVTEKQLETANQRAKTYGELVDALAMLEHTNKGKLPDDAEVRILLESVNKSPQELASDVKTAVDISRLRNELKDEAAALEGMKQTQETIDREREEFEAVAAKHTTRQDQLAAELREQAQTCEHFKSARNRLHSLAGQPSPREQELAQEIAELQRQEAQLRMRAGRTGLPEKYVNKSADEFPEAKRLAILISGDETAIAAEVRDNPLKTPGPRLLAIESEIQALEAQVEKIRKNCELGAKIKANRERVAELAAKRDRLGAERRAAIETG